jgi:TPR repeat protein
VAQYALGEIYFHVQPRDVRQAITYFERSAAAGYPQAQATLGALLLKGMPPVLAKDLPKGIQLLKQATEHQSMTGRYNLGMAYYNGDGVQKNNEIAARWIRLAADQNFTEAQFAFAQLLLEMDPEANKREAIQFLQLASARNHSASREKLAELAKGSLAPPLVIPGLTPEEAKDAHQGGEPPDGLVVRRYEDGQKKEEVNYKDGKPHGPYVHWHANGRKQAEGTFRNGQPDGIEITWYENGQKKKEATHKEGKLVTIQVWRPDGEKCPESKVLAGAGALIGYHEDGTKCFRSTYENGQLTQRSSFHERNDNDAELNQLLLAAEIEQLFERWEEITEEMDKNSKRLAMMEKRIQTLDEGDPERKVLETRIEKGLADAMESHLARKQFSEKLAAMKNKRALLKRESPSPAESLPKELPSPGAPVPSVLSAEPVVSPHDIQITGGESFDHDTIRASLKSNPNFVGWMSELNRKGFEQPRQSILFDSLAHNVLTGLRLRGFLDGKVSIDSVGEPGDSTLSVQIKEGRQWKYKGVEIADGIPEWLMPRLRMALGQAPQELARFRDRLLPESNKPYLKGKALWFGRTDLLSPSISVAKKLVDPEAEGAGYFHAQGHQLLPRFDATPLASHLQWLKEFSTNQRKLANIPFAFDKKWQRCATLLIGELGAARGQPGVAIEVTPVRRGAFFHTRIGVTGLQPIRLGGIQLTGLKNHDPAEVRKWLADEAGLVGGELLTTGRLESVRQDLLDSCSFYDVGVRPAKLEGETDLLITLSDSPRLPNLGAKRTPAEKLLMEAGRFVARSKHLQLNLRLDHPSSPSFTLSAGDRLVRIQLETKDGNKSKVGKIEARDNRLFIQGAPGSVPLASEVSKSVEFYLGLTIVPDEVADANESIAKGNFSFSFGFSNKKVGSPGIMIHRKVMPAIFVLRDTEGKADYRIVSQDARRTIIASNEKEYVVHRRQGVLHAVEIRPGLPGEKEDETPFKSLSIIFRLDSPDDSSSFPEDTPLLDESSFWTEVVQLAYPSMRDLLTQLMEAEEETGDGDVTAKQRNASVVQQELFFAMVQSVLVPFAGKLSDFFELNKATGEETAPLSPQVTADGKLVFHCCFQGFLNASNSEPFGVLLDRFYEDSLQWNKGFWPRMLADAGFSLYSGETKNLGGTLNALANDSSLGPLGNLAIAHLCEIIGMKPAVPHFLKRARQSGSFLLFEDDLKQLGLINNLPGLFEELSQDPKFYAALAPEIRARFKEYHVTLLAATDPKKKQALAQQLAFLLFRAYFNDWFDAWVDAVFVKRQA